MSINLPVYQQVTFNFLCIGARVYKPGASAKSS